MIIYPLPPCELANKPLSVQIRNIAKTLCNVHWDIADENILNSAKVLLQPSRDKAIIEYCNWGLQCAANYDYLVKMGRIACEEWEYRFNPFPIKGGTHYIINDDPEQKKRKYNRHKLKSVIKWAAENKPDLPFVNEPTPFPLCVPEKYKHNRTEIIIDAIDGRDLNTLSAYRNYYRAKVREQRLTKFIMPIWSRREIPEYLK